MTDDAGCTLELQPRFIGIVDGVGVGVGRWVAVADDVAAPAVTPLAEESHAEPPTRSTLANVTPCAKRSTDLNLMRNDSFRAHQQGGADPYRPRYLPSCVRRQGGLPKCPVVALCNKCNEAPSSKLLMPGDVVGSEVARGFGTTFVPSEAAEYDVVLLPHVLQMPMPRTPRLSAFEASRC